MNACSIAIVAFAISTATAAELPTAGLRRLTDRSRAYNDPDPEGASHAPSIADPLVLHYFSRHECIGSGN
jgi:hypothetical protein